MKIKSIILGLFVLVGCSGLKINSSADPAANFEDYQTFCWMAGCEQNYSGPSSTDQAMKMRMLRDRIKEVLEEKGYMNDSISPDILVGFHVTIEEKEVVVNQVDAVPNPPYSSNISYWNGYENYFKEDVQRFLKGTLIIDLIDADESAVIWQGSVERYMERNPELDREKMKKTIRRLLRDLPSRQ